MLERLQAGQLSQPQGRRQARQRRQLPARPLLLLPPAPPLLRRYRRGRGAPLCPHPRPQPDLLLLALATGSRRSAA
jgi:hypothetical protein